MSSYDDYKPKRQKPTKELLNISNAVVSDVPGGKAIIIGFEDATNTILSRLRAYHYKTVIATQEVVDAILDLNPEAFNGVDDLEVVNVIPIHMSWFNNKFSEWPSC